MMNSSSSTSKPKRSAWKSPVKPWIDCSPQEKRLLEATFRAGDLRWKLPPSQREVYDAVKKWRAIPDPAWRKFMMDIGRRFGKSSISLVMAFEDGFTRRGWNIPYIGPVEDEIEGIVMPLIEEFILIDCPPAMRPKWIKSDLIYEFHSGTKIRFIGLDKNPNGARGKAFDMAYLDEAGFFSNLSYIVNSILQPQMLGRPHARVVMGSTPPVSPEHYWSRDLLPECVKHGAYIKRRLRDASQYSEEEIDRFYEEMPGGAKGVAARREYDAEHIADAELIIIPEFADAEPHIVKEWDAPAWRDCYVAMDPGFHDMTGILYGYWDFYSQKLVIEGEDAAPKLNSARIAECILRKEKKLWGSLKRRGGHTRDDLTDQPYLRISDNDPRLLYDLSVDHKLRFIATQKDNLVQQVNSVRVAIQRHDILIHPSCTKLIAHLKNGVWRKGRIGKDFDREGESFGHFDLIAALVYLWRNINKSRNPEPRVLKYVAGDLVAKNQGNPGPNSKWYRQGGRIYINTGRR